MVDVDGLETKSPEQVALESGMFPPITSTTQDQVTHQTHNTEDVGPFVVGDKVFKTQAEALAYADGVVRAQANASASMSRQAQEPVTTQPVGVKLGQLIFEDPEQALAMVKEQAKTEMRSEQLKIDQTRIFWENFYSKHPDLKGSEFLVDAALANGQRNGEYNHMTYDQAAPVIAAKARQEISKIRNVPNGGQALSSAPAIVAGASGAPTQKVQMPAAPAQTNFVQELQRMRKRG